MIITKKQISTYIAQEELTFTPPLDSFQLQAHSVDLRLGFTFMVPKMWKVTPKGREALNISPLQEQGKEYFEIIELEKGQFFDLLPQEYVLVSSLETICIPSNLMAILYPRSSTNRKGLSVDLTGIIDAGYEGQLVIPIRNNTRSQVIRLYPGERFCQLAFEQLTESVDGRKSRFHKRDIIEGNAEEDNNETSMIMKGEIQELKTQFPMSK